MLFIHYYKNFLGPLVICVSKGLISCLCNNHKRRVLVPTIPSTLWVNFPQSLDTYRGLLWSDFVWFNLLTLVTSLG